ncbi:MAG: SDR family oxidoreductase [Oceanipulchritudo sp.]|jgi:NAD(P)-dependent dehydrogenase (short-subunit alcohol dehydrogenase family)
MPKTILGMEGNSGIGLATVRQLQAQGDHVIAAALVCFLLSDASKFMTGQIIRPAGGLSSVRTF